MPKCNHIIHHNTITVIVIIAIHTNINAFNAIIAINNHCNDGFFIYLPIYAIFEYGNKIIGEIYVMYGLKRNKEKPHLKMSIVKHWIQNIDEIPPKQTLCVYEISDLGDSSGKLSLSLKSLLSKGIQLWIMNSNNPIKLNSKESYFLAFKIIDFHRTERSKNQKKAMRRAKQSGSVLGRKSKFSDEEKSAIIREKILTDKSAHEIASDYGLSVTTVYRWWQEYVKENGTFKNVP